MDFEPWFTPEDALLRFVFMERAFESGEQAISDWRNEHEENVYDFMDRATPPGHSKLSENDFHMRHRKESRLLDIDNMHQEHRSAYVIMSFALCEASCTKFADLILRQKGSPLRIRQISGSGLERLKTVASAYGISVKVLTGKQWAEIVAYRELRNCLAHNGGLVERDRIGPKLQALIEDSHGIELKAYGEAELSSIVMRDFFVRHVISQLRKATDSVADALFGREDMTC